MNEHHMSSHEQQRIQEELSKRAVPLTCEVCKRGEMTIANSYVPLPIMESPLGGTTPTPYYACAATQCDYCGYTRIHGLHQLGLMPRP